MLALAKAASLALVLTVTLTGCYMGGYTHLATLDDMEREFLDLSKRGSPKADDADRRVMRIINEQTQVLTLVNFCEKYPSSQHAQEARARIASLLTTITDINQLSAISAKTSDLAPKVDERLRNIVTTNANFLNMERACNAISDTKSKAAAESRISSAIQESSNLPDLADLAVFTPATTRTEAAAARAEQLIASWVQNQDGTKVKDLLKTGYASKARGSRIASSALTGAQTIVKNTWEVVAQDEYKRNFKAPDDSFLPDLMYEIRRKRGMAQNGSISVSYHTRDNYTQTFISSGPVQDGVVELSFSTDGLNYSRSEYGGNNIVYEVITRTGSRGSATVTTEVYHFNSLVYRTSKVTGL